MFRGPPVKETAAKALHINGAGREQCYGIGAVTSGERAARAPFVVAERV
jgi:hypothetical protein